MTMADREARMLDSIYRTYGRTAEWTRSIGGEPLTPVVRHDVRDVADRFGPGESLLRTNLVYVRRSEPFEPALDDVVVIARPAGGADTLRLIADPRLEPGGLEWLCEAAALD